MSKKLFIIAGHGGSNPYDPGACGNGYEEAKLVRKLADKLKLYGGENVIVGDTSKNWYAEKLISKYEFPSGIEILELHMDASDNASAKGASVLIDLDFGPDKYDTALATYVTSVFPGRSKAIDNRNLRNSNAAQARGISYRLLESGFITNKSDVDKYIASIDTYAKGILGCFGIPIVDTTKVNKTKNLNVQVTMNADGVTGTFKIIE